MYVSTHNRHGMTQMSACCMIGVRWEYNTAVFLLKILEVSIESLDTYDISRWSQEIVSLKYNYDIVVFEIETLVEY